MSLSKVLYRDLMHVAKEFDRHAALRALISSNMLQRPVDLSTKARLRHIEHYNRCLLEFLQNKSFYLPSRERKPLVTLVREQFRSQNGEQADDAEPVVNGNERERMDTAFVVLKALNDKLADAMDLGVVTKKTAKQTREGKKKKEKETAVVDKRLLERVQLAENLATGIFLLSHPLLSGSFNRSVIILTSHSQAGSKGFIVNQPTSSPLMKAFKVHPRIMKAFGSSKVRTGGPVRTDHAEIIHGRADFGGDRLRASNFDDPADEDMLFVGVDLDTAARAVDEQLAKQSEVVFINGISTWTAGQLENEMARGTWVGVKAPLSLALNAKKDLWQDMMRALGGEYAEFSIIPPIDDDDDEVEYDDE